jgi:hypothetical protein
MTKTQEIPADVMAEAQEIARAARKLVRNTIDAIAVEEMLRDRILAGLLAERLHGDTSARKECVEIARRISAHHNPRRDEIATAIEATIGGSDE